jgi:hypothetical protein
MTAPKKNTQRRRPVDSFHKAKLNRAREIVRTKVLPKFKTSREACISMDIGHTSFVKVMNGETFGLEVASKIFTWEEKNAP